MISSISKNSTQKWDALKCLSMIKFKTTNIKVVSVLLVNSITNGINFNLWCTFSNFLQTISDYNANTSIGS